MTGALLYREAYRRLAAASVLVGLHDPAGARRIERIARSRLRSVPFRVFAAVQLVAADPGRGLRLLERLAAPGRRPRLRLAAATQLAYRCQRLDALVEFVTDPRMGTGKRVEALEYVRRAGGRTALADTEDLITVPIAGRLLAADVVPVPPRMPEADMKRIAALAHDAAAPARLRIAAATSALPAAQAAGVLAALAAEPRHGVRARSTAAARLADLDPGLGIAAQRALVADAGIPRLLRWFVLVEGDLIDLAEFAEQRALIERLDTDWRLPLRILRLAAADPCPRESGG